MLLDEFVPEEPVVIRKTGRQLRKTIPRVVSWNPPGVAAKVRNKSTPPVKVPDDRPRDVVGRMLAAVDGAGEETLSITPIFTGPLLPIKHPLTDPGLPSFEPHLVDRPQRQGAVSTSLDVLSLYPNTLAQVKHPYTDPALGLFGPLSSRYWTAPEDCPGVGTIEAVNRPPPAGAQVIEVPAPRPEPEVDMSEIPQLRIKKRWGRVETPWERMRREDDEEREMEAEDERAREAEERARNEEFFARRAEEDEEDERMWEEWDREDAAEKRAREDAAEKRAREDEGEEETLNLSPRKKPRFETDASDYVFEPFILGEEFAVNHPPSPPQDFTELDKFFMM